MRACSGWMTTTLGLALASAGVLAESTETGFAVRWGPEEDERLHATESLLVEEVNEDQASRRHEASSAVW